MRIKLKNYLKDYIQKFEHQRKEMDKVVTNEYKTIKKQIMKMITDKHKMNDDEQSASESDFDF